ncbi:uncharacterized protein B0H18DRAFT_959980 [Fomitopsis serialis]|uniref:uncharacterized protein n=1 Tax=Fomitopsis serialis TaxID=139415 RepID=UPI002008E915|nr:uncharacterized protein B0H18DRAFT_959980 [Neoantrodia serialis]KAH9914246.1 hypothetical protein B0H18DRAFT_959980 [Neoantrodia serialis]
MIDSSDHVVSRSVATKINEPNMTITEQEEGDAADEDVDELEESDVGGTERAEERRQVKIEFHGDYKCDRCKCVEERAQRRAAKLGKGPNEIAPFICTISGRRKRCDFCSKGRRPHCSVQPYLINSLVSVDKDLVGTYTSNHAPEATVTGIESNTKIYSPARVQDDSPRTKHTTSLAKPKRKNTVKAAKKVAGVRSSASQPRKRAQPRTRIATSVTGSSSHSNNSPSCVETDLLNEEGPRLRSTAEEAPDVLRSDVRRLESEMHELRNALEAERAFRKEVAVDLAKLRSEVDDLRAGTGVCPLAAHEPDISSFIARVRRPLGSVDDRDDCDMTRQTAGASAMARRETSTLVYCLRSHGDDPDFFCVTPKDNISSHSLQSDDLQPVMLHATALNAHGVHHPAAAAPPSQPRRRSPSEARPERRDPPAGGSKHGGLAREDVRQVDIGDARRLSAKRWQDVAFMRSPVQGVDHLVSRPRLWTGQSQLRGNRSKVGESRSRWSGTVGGAMPGCEEEKTPYHVLAAPNALAKATLRAKISELQPTPRPPIRRPVSPRSPLLDSPLVCHCFLHGGVAVHLLASPDAIPVYDGAARPLTSDSSESVLPLACADSHASAFEQSPSTAVQTFYCHLCTVADTAIQMCE